MHEQSPDRRRGRVTTPDNVPFLTWAGDRVVQSPPRLKSSSAHKHEPVRAASPIRAADAVSTDGDRAPHKCTLSTCTLSTCTLSNRTDSSGAVSYQPSRRRPGCVGCHGHDGHRRAAW